MRDKRLSLLGLAVRARKVIHGEDAVLHQVAKYANNVLFLAADAGQNITKKIHNKATTYNLHVINTYSSEALSQATGKQHVKVLLITDNGFSTALK
jgi:ribosomal protein L7Ae-like RNA K-turn-binding protein